MIRVLLVLAAAAGACAQGARDNGAGGVFLRALGAEEFAARSGRACDARFRSLDGSCGNPKVKLWGSSGLPHFSYWPVSAAVARVDGLPNARAVSDALCRQSRDHVNARGLSDLVVFFGQFVDHTTVATPTNTDDPLNIKIPSRDPIFSNFTGGILPFSRSRRFQATNTGLEKPINSLSSFLDLASIYGSEKLRSKELRAFVGGKLKSGPGKLLPTNIKRLRNAPSNEPRFFLSGDHRANEHPVLTSLHILFNREHNLLCEEFAAAYPDWDDEHLFQMARKINGAQFQKIVYEEFLPVMMGRKLPKYWGFKAWVNPSISDVFSTAAFRVGHSMVSNGIRKRGVNMAPMAPISMKEMFFRGPSVIKAAGIEPFLRGSVFFRAQEVDLKVHDSLRNFLFTGIPEETGFDLIALNIQRGRDHVLPSYNQIRRLFGLKKVTSFKQITSKKNVQSALSSLYRSVDAVDAWIGMVAEDHEPGSSLGITMLTVWEAEFLRLRDGDNFFYKRRGMWDKELWRKMPRVRAMFVETETLKAILLRNTDIKASEISGSVWYSQQK